MQLHAATAVGSGYTASYDASGNMTCRAPTNSVTCSGTQTGAQLNYDNEGRLSAWQNAPSAPTWTASYLYDGEGNRVFQQSTTGGTTTVYYYFGGQRVAESVNGTLSYLTSDLLGSAEVALNGAGSATASVLYGPYGRARSTTGAMSGSYGFTGQHHDHRHQWYIRHHCHQRHVRKRHPGRHWEPCRYTTGSGRHRVCGGREHLHGSS